MQYKDDSKYGIFATRQLREFKSYKIPDGHMPVFVVEVFLRIISASLYILDRGYAHLWSILNLLDEEQFHLHIPVLFLLGFSQGSIFGQRRTAFYFLCLFVKLSCGFSD